MPSTGWSQAGVTMIVVNVHYKGEMLRAHLARRHDVEIRFSDESDELLDTGGGVVKALHHFEASPFFMLNSDSIWVEGPVAALAAMIGRWNPERMDGLLLLAAMTPPWAMKACGDFMMEADGHVLRAPRAAGAAFAYPGVQIVHPRLFDDAPEGTFSTNLMWDRAIAKGRLYGIRLDGVWIHVGTPEARDEAEAYLRAPAVKHPNVFTIAPSAPFARDAGAGADRARRWRSAGAVRSPSSICPRGARRAPSAMPSRVCWAARRCCRNSSRWATATKTSCCFEAAAEGLELPPAIAPHAAPAAAGRSWCGAGTARDAAARCPSRNAPALADSLAT